MGLENTCPYFGLTPWPCLSHVFGKWAVAVPPLGLFPCVLVSRPPPPAGAEGTVPPPGGAWPLELQWASPHCLSFSVALASSFSLPQLSSGAPPRLPPVVPLHPEASQQLPQLPPVLQSLSRWSRWPLPSPRSQRGWSRVCSSDLGCGRAPGCLHPLPRASPLPPWLPKSFLHSSQNVLFKIRFRFIIRTHERLFNL